jgi:hypothetical protein
MNKSLSYMVFGEFLVAGNGGCEGDEDEEVTGVALVAQGQSPVTGQPGERSFDDPAPSGSTRPA